jgi:vacuolar protein-sorting-associated protein 4
MMARNSHDLEPKDFEELAELTKDCSGSDISVFVKYGCYEPLREMQKATHFKKNKDGAWVVATAGEAGSVKAALTELEDGKVATRKVSMKDFRTCLANLKPSVNPASLKKYV